MKNSQKQWYDHDLFVDVPDRAVALEMTPERVQSRIVWLESIIRAGDADYERLTPDIPEIAAIVKKPKAKTVVYNGGWWHVAALRGLLRFHKEWEARRFEYAEQLKPLYALYETFPINPRTRNTGVKRQTRNGKVGSK